MPHFHGRQSFDHLHDRLDRITVDDRRPVTEHLVDRGPPFVVAANPGRNKGDAGRNKAEEIKGRNKGDAIL
jgi:hypothetical protein